MSQKSQFEIMNQKITIDEKTRNDIRVANTEYEAQRDLLLAVIETHLCDDTDEVTTSRVFLALLDVVTDAYKCSETAKDIMVKKIPVDDNTEVTDWSLDYDSCEVQYHTAKKLKKVTATYTIAGDVCDDIQTKQIKSTVVRDMLTTMTNNNLTNTRNTFVGGPIYKNLVSMQAKLVQDFEKAKDEMFRNTVDVDKRNEYTSWNLNYVSRKLECY